ncbi:MAG: lactate utilization protein [Sphaerochaetaceae bacterium]
MDANRNKIKEMMIARTIGKLKKNNMDAAYLPGMLDVVPMLRSLLEEGDTIALGGSMTLAETGALRLVHSSDYHLIDRYAPGITPEQTRQAFIDAFSADVFLTSVNAITEHGELYNVDGTSNRAAAMLFGPKRVIVVAGWQKIVPTLRDAVDRVKHIAAPANSLRLEKDTPCVKSGHCIAPFCDERNLMSITPGACEQTICSNMVVMGRQKDAGRIMVLIVGEAVGY